MQSLEAACLCLFALLAACAGPIRPDLERLYVNTRQTIDQPPVIFIPGLMGTRLRDPDSGKDVWPGSFVDLFGYVPKSGVNPSRHIRCLQIWHSQQSREERLITPDMPTLPNPVLVCQERRFENHSLRAALMLSTQMTKNGTYFVLDIKKRPRLLA